MPTTSDITYFRQKLLHMMCTSDVSDENFTSLALDIFRFQFEYNLPYQNYCQALHREPKHRMLSLHLAQLLISVASIFSLHLIFMKRPFWQRGNG